MPEETTKAGRGRTLSIIALVVLVIGLGGFARFGSELQSVEAIGLFSSGLAAGAGLALLVIGLRD